MQGAGGIGGLLAIKPASGDPTFVAYDGNGNVTGLIDATTGTTTGNFEYGPFGETIRLTPNVNNQSPFRFSTKYTDDESDFAYYGYRYYNSSTGRWLSRDPLTDQSSLVVDPDEHDDDDTFRREPESAPMAFVNNNPTSSYDALGLWPSSSPFLGFLLGGIPLTHQNAIHRAIPNLSFNDEQWLNVATVYVDKFQRPSDSFMHAMKNGHSHETKAHARQLANDFVRTHIERAETFLCSQCSDLARSDALLEFGQALHTVQDSTSPAHHDFKAWHGLGLNPIDHVRALRHVIRETFDPGPDSQLYQATTWLWSFLQCKESAPPLPSDFFHQFGYDSKEGY